jgi:Ser/Thr protein kinase RdoA (MazF antagonist)
MIDTALLGELAGHYPELRGTVTCEVPPHEGRTMRLRLRSRRGEFLLKEKAYYLHPAEYAAHLQFQHRLIAGGADVEALVPSRTGALAVAVGDRQFRLSRWIEGEHPTARGADAGHALGAALGALHGRAAAFAAPPDAGLATPRARRRTYPRAAADWRSLLARQLPPTGGEAFATAPIYRRLTRRVAALLAGRPFTRLPHAMIHGDAHAHNVVRDRRGRLIWIDFEDARWDARVVDLAWLALLGAAYEWEGPSQRMRLRESLDRAFITAALVAYQDRVALTRAEQRALPTVLELLLIATFDNCLERERRWASLDRFTTELARLERLQQGLRHPTGALVTHGKSTP